MKLEWRVRNDTHWTEWKPLPNGNSGVQDLIIRSLFAIGNRIGEITIDFEDGISSTQYRKAS